jgi:branched-chain amino acid transport system permease protein
VHDFIGFTIAGLVTAGVYAIVASGLTLTYTTTGVFNWAHGAVVAVGAFAYWQFTVEWGLPVPVGIVACLVLGVAIGMAIETAVTHRLEGTSESTKMVVTLALLLGLIAAMNWIWDPSVARYVPQLFSGHQVTVAGQRIPYHDIVVITTALGVAVGLRYLLFRTKAGVEMRATVDDRTLAVLNGVSPARTAMRSWAISGASAVLAGMLIATRASLSATALSLLIVNAYAAAIIGRLRSLPLTFLGAVIIGLLGAYGQGYLASGTSTPGVQYLSGLITVMPAVVLFVALQFLPQDRLRGARTARTREIATPPTWRGSATLAASVIAATILVAPLLSTADLNSVTKVWGLAIVALSLVPLVGYAGQLSVCPLSFAAVGAIVASHLGSSGNPAVLVVVVVVSAGVGALVSLTAIRLSGLYLALATAAFAVMLDNWIFRLPSFTVVVRVPFTDATLYRHTVELVPGSNLTIERFRLFGIDTSSDHAFVVFGAVVFGLAVLAVTLVRRSDFGLRLVAVKDSQVGYATLGLNHRRTTMAAFALSAGLAGLGGAVLGAAIQRPPASAFSFFAGLTVLLAVVVLGVNSIGSSVGAGLFVGAPALGNLFPSLAELSATLVATAGIGLGKNPNGIIPSDLRPAWNPVARSRLVVGAGLAVLVAAYVLTLTDVINGWAFAGAVLAVLIAMPLAAKAVVEPPAPLAERDAALDGLSTTPELLGVNSPFTRADLAIISSRLELPEIPRERVSHGA